MSNVVLTLGPGHTLRDAATRMTEKGVGAAVVIDEESPGPRIISERDILNSLGKGEDPDSESVGDHMSDMLIAAAPDWSLERAAMEMAKRHIRHLVVVEGGRARRHPLDARHRARLDVGGRDLGDDVPRERGDRGVAGSRLNGLGVALAAPQRHGRQDGGGQTLLAGKPRDLVPGIAEPGPKRGKQDDRAGDCVGHPGEQADEHAGEAGGG